MTENTPTERAALAQRLARSVASRPPAQGVIQIRLALEQTRWLPPKHYHHVMDEAQSELDRIRWAAKARRLQASYDTALEAATDK